MDLIRFRAPKYARDDWQPEFRGREKAHTAPQGPGDSNPIFS